MGDDATAAVMALMPGLFKASGELDPLAVASALAQLQHQQGAPPCSIAFPPDRSGIKKCGHCQVRVPIMNLPCCCSFVQSTPSCTNIW